MLACTHYPLLLDRFERLAPWPVTFLDPAPAIARRVTDLIGPATGRPAPVAGRITFTSRPRALARARNGACSDSD